jgi:hypothetical protein
MDWLQFFQTLAAVAIVQGLCRLLNPPREIHHTHLVFPRSHSLSIEVSDARLKPKDDSE